MTVIGEDKIAEKLDEIKNLMKGDSGNVVAYKTRIFPMTHRSMEPDEFAVSIRRNDRGGKWYEEMTWLRKKGMEKMGRMQRDMMKMLYDYLKEHLDGGYAIFYGETEGYNIVNDAVERLDSSIPYKSKVPYYRIRIQDGNIDSSIDIYHRLDTHDIGNDNIAERMKNLAGKYEVRAYYRDSAQIIYSENVEDFIRELLYGCNEKCKDAKIKDVFPNYADETLLMPSINIAMKVKFARSMEHVNRLTNLLKEFSYMYTYDSNPDALKIALSGLSREEMIDAVETILKNRNSEKTQQWLTENFPDISKELAIKQFCDATGVVSDEVPKNG